MKKGGEVEISDIQFSISDQENSKHSEFRDDADSPDQASQEESSEQSSHQDSEVSDENPETDPGDSNSEHDENDHFKLLGE
mmetsp:Transcript_2955/g.3629  ORF Transcript_2955/g.3629 Transcript_2955/m.3629 type:complete len:81 (-) Transcript_2955:1490-1732(-)